MTRWCLPVLLTLGLTHAEQLTHQVGSNETQLLREWQQLHSPANVSQNVHVTRSMAEDLSPWNRSVSFLFKRQRIEDENGALLCPDGTCPDKRHVEAAVTLDTADNGV